MILRRYRYAVALAITIMLAAPHANAITLTLRGPEPESVAPNTDLTSTIWASSGGGTMVKIATVGDDAPGGGTFSEMGVPSISPESQVIFGAEVTAPDGAARWEIFRGDPAASADRRVPDGKADGCAVAAQRDDGRRPLLALVVGQHLRLAVFKAGHDRVAGAEVDADVGHLFNPLFEDKEGWSEGTISKYTSCGQFSSGFSTYCRRRRGVRI